MTPSEDDQRDRSAGRSLVIAAARSPGRALAAAGLDISLWGEPASPWPELARVAALLKFGAIGLALAYGLTGVIAASISWARRLQAG